ncbi:hypothetical protein BDR03DRAFT_1017879 [Suillus americanus]|nr:hypothetical protein BDR03DRAFT_1017879 [Suillus americanus]
MQINSQNSTSVYLTAKPYHESLTPLFSNWRRSVELALAGEGLWNHCSNGTDPSDVTEMASVMPTAATARQPTSAELTSMKDWVKEDAQAKAIIGRRLSPIVQNMLSEKLTAC